MEYSRTVNNYSQALFSAAKKVNRLKKTEEGLLLLLAAHRSSSHFRQFLLTKRINVPIKVDIINAMFKKLVGALERDLLNLLLENNDSEYLTDIIAQYQDLAAFETDTVKVSIHTAQKLDQTDQERIIADLEKQLHKKIEALTVQNPELIGGLKLRIGNKIIDGTISRRLERLKANLLRN